MTSNALYWILVRLLGWLVWNGRLLDRHNLPHEFPVVFVSNRAAALGPFGVTASLPVRTHAWVASEMLDRSRAAGYLLKDLLPPHLRAGPRFDTMFSRLLAWVTVPVLHAVGCIPILQGEGRSETFRLSQQHLGAGHSLLIFPEDPAGELNELFMMRPFMKGFTRLGELYFEHTRRILRFYPLAVNPGARKVKVGRPVSYNPYNNVVQERLRLKRTLEAAVHNLYLSIILDDYAGIPLPP